MSTLEIFATILTLLCVFLAVKLNTAQYPVGIIGTILFFFVFWNAQLYFSAGLQVFFTLVQIYGWWYWTKGDHGKAPKVTYVNWGWFIFVLIFIPPTFADITQNIASYYFPDAKMPLIDAHIFGMSVLAQWYLDRKKIQTWIVWMIVNIFSIGLYYSQGLTLTSIVYVVLLFNTGYGYYEWRKEFKKQNEKETNPRIL